VQRQLGVDDEDRQPGGTGGRRHPPGWSASPKVA
jgi:hypothetical protein